MQAHAVFCALHHLYILKTKSFKESCAVESYTEYFVLHCIQGTTVLYLDIKCRQYWRKTEPNAIFPENPILFILVAVRSSKPIATTEACHVNFLTLRNEAFQMISPKFLVSRHALSKDCNEVHKNFLIVSSNGISSAVCGF